MPRFRMIAPVAAQQIEDIGGVAQWSAVRNNR
jgi:hypothetical protein